MEATRVLAAFTALLDQPSEVRASMIDSLAEGDLTLAQELRALLAADAAADGFLGLPAGPAIGDRVGPWQLQRLLGEGGMGQVWLAARADGQYEAQVAIKFMRLALPEFSRRFALERRALARLDHPQIARLLDAGVEQGRPWIAMEWVQGQSLREWSQGQDLRARMQLLASVAETVHAAHTRLVVHRDLKPANILVTADDTPKLLDFGIAKLLDQNIADVTRDGTQPYTPAYASPEQLRGEAIGTASDVYALGVVAYELATGELPARVAPAPPSACCLRDWRSQLTGDLDQVILHALADDPAKRHPSAAAWATDLRHWLAGAQVSVRAAPWGERLKRWVRRHRLEALAVLTTVSALLIGGGVAVWQAHIAQASALQAIAERDKASAGRHFLEQILASADPRRGRRDMSVVEALTQAETLVDQNYVAQPALAAEVLCTLSRTWRGLGDFDHALRSAERAWTQVQQADGSAADRAQVLLELAQVHAERGDAQALARFDEGLGLLAGQRSNALLRADLLNNRGVLKRQLGDLDGADRDYAAALDDYREGGADAQQIGELLNNQAVLAGSRGDAVRAADLHRQAVAAIAAVLPAAHPDVAEARIGLANALEILGELGAADAEYAAALPALVTSLGADHPKVIQARASYAWLLLRRQQAALALAVATQAVAGAEQSLQATHPLRAYALSMRGEAHARLLQWPAAVQDLAQALAARRQSLPAEHWLIASTANALAWARLHAGDASASAKEEFTATLTTLITKLGAEHEVVLRAQIRRDDLIAAGLLH